MSLAQAFPAEEVTLIIIIIVFDHHCEEEEDEHDIGKSMRSDHQWCEKMLIFVLTFLGENLIVKTFHCYICKFEIVVGCNSNLFVGSESESI